MIFLTTVGSKQSQAFSSLGLYQSRGATFIEHDHWLLLAHFGDPMAEYGAVRNYVGILDLCQRNLLRFTGRDRTLFLNRYISNDQRQ